MGDVIDFVPKGDIVYITGNESEPSVVGVKTGGGSIELAPDLHDVIVNENWVTRDQFIAFIFATDIWHDIDKVIKQSGK